MKPVGARKKWHRCWHLATGCCRKPKERTQGKDECRKKLAAARRMMTSRAGVAQCKGHRRQCHGQDNVVRAQKGRTLGRRQRMHREGSTETRYQGLRQQLRSMWEFTKIYTEAFGLGFVKQAAGMSSGSRKVRDWTLWRGRPFRSEKTRTGRCGGRGRPPPKWKKR